MNKYLPAVALTVTATVYLALFYILGNALLKETLNDHNTMVWLFLAVGGMTLGVGLYFFSPQDERP